MPFMYLAGEAMKQYEQAIKAGLKLQGEMAECWGRSFEQPVGMQDWQKRFTQWASLANSAMPLAQEQMREMVQLMEKSTRTSSELMQKAMEAAQTPVIADSQSKWIDFWSSSLGAVQENAEALTQLNAKALGSCLEFVRKNTEVTQVRVPKAA
jgi:hypothetical protein